MTRLGRNTEGFTLIELLVSISIVGVLAGLLLPALAGAKTKVRRIICANNLSQQGKAFTGFAMENDGRLPWQLTKGQANSHFGDYYEEELGAIFSIVGLKSEYQTAKILHSPCDPLRTANNEAAQERWEQYDTSTGQKLPWDAISYLLVRGADMGRPSTILSTTRNISHDDLARAYWCGNDEKPTNDQVMAGLSRSQGQLVLADGSVHQSMDTDLGSNGKRVVAHAHSHGGLTTGPANSQTIGYGSEVSLLIVYHDNVLDLYQDAAGILRRAKIAVAEVNTGLSRSGAGAQLKLAATESIDYRTAGNIGADLGGIRADKETAKLRKHHKADLVCLVSEAGGGGVAYMGGGSSFGFSVIARHTLGGGWTLGHEVGHNLGCAHQTGHAFTDGKTGYYTVMSYGPGNDIPEEIRHRVRFQGRLLYSNPEVRYNGFWLGTKTNNNAGTIEHNARYISRYY